MKNLSFGTTCGQQPCPATHKPYSLLNYLQVLALKNNRREQSYTFQTLKMIELKIRLGTPD